ncbi:3-isopropylmalate dehydratase small subunit [Streptomyces sp. BK208]|uniref:3-isopropylmalate dehydratase small subunit n=1 Tax=Streptomyces sp. BK208 TaxID=2512150 RepID=UPI00105D931A|nr:3-isopropylmalate dehydratase small subunit [Streptomyces sp. BK208]
MTPTTSAPPPASAPTACPPAGVHVGTAVPLRVRDVDTDQIIPARFCTNTERTGFADGLFADRRADDSGFVLDDPRHRGASVIVAAENFGTGSSREAAVWALAEHGIRVVLSPRFGDIFRANAWFNGLYAVTVPQSFVDAVWRAVDADPATEVRVDLADLTVTGAGIVQPFALDADTQIRLLRGQDAIGATLHHEDDVRAYETHRAPTPTTTARFPAAGPRRARRPRPAQETPMSPEDRVHALYRRIDEGDFAGFAALFHEDAVYHRPGSPALVGRDAIEAYYRDERTVADGTHTLSRVLLSDGALAVDGAFSGHLTDGREQAHRFAEIFEFGPDGLFTRRDSFLFVLNF